MRVIFALLVFVTVVPAFASGDVAGFDDRSGAVLPNVAFVDDDGTIVHTAQFFDKPMYLAFAFHTCPQICGLVLGRLATALRDVPGRAADAFNVVVVSIDPNDTPQRSRDAKRRYVERYGGDGNGWHFLTGSESEIRAFAQAAGFRYLFDPIRQTFVHPAGVLYVDRGGVVRGHVEGTDFSAASLAEARASRSSTWDRLCGALGIGPGVHSAAAIAALRIVVMITLMAIGGFVVWRVRKSGAAR
ncbi:MAG TPA: SCO family protein [Rudaea sp.]|jgi:protein SCO1/2|nr:SCO family protein [Rudaea sp.]